MHEFGSKLTALPSDAHKGQAGRVLCLAGSRLMPGAALLVARAAGRSGAGLVSVACMHEALLQVVPLGFPEAVLLDLSKGGLRAAWVQNAHAMLAGPGLGAGNRVRELVEELLRAGPGLPRVLDADALNVFAGRARDLRAAAGPLVITPHVGEARRLLGSEVPSDDAGRRSFALQLAEESGAIVCLKGAGTVISDGSKCVTNTSGNPGMASAGSGDVLAGILVALLAREAAAERKLDVLGLTALAAFLHGRAGDLAAERLGQRSLLASDLIDGLPAAFGELT